MANPSIIAKISKVDESLIKEFLAKISCRNITLERVLKSSAKPSGGWLTTAADLNRQVFRRRYYLMTSTRMKAVKDINIGDHFLSPVPLLKRMHRLWQKQPGTITLSTLTNVLQYKTFQGKDLPWITN